LQALEAAQVSGRLILRPKPPGTRCNSRFDDSAQKPNGIVDERGVYFRDKSRKHRGLDRIRAGPGVPPLAGPSIVQPGARARGFGTIVIAPVMGNDQYAVGHLLLDGFHATDAVLRERLAGGGVAAPK
jgi:hypothetical protein